MMTASVAMGVAVDDTIHFLTWFRDGMAAGMPRHKAIVEAYRRCAAAMTQTTLDRRLGAGRVRVQHLHADPVLRYDDAAVAVCRTDRRLDLPAGTVGWTVGQVFLPQAGAAAERTETPASSGSQAASGFGAPHIGGSAPARRTHRPQGSRTSPLSFLMTETPLTPQTPATPEPPDRPGRLVPGPWSAAIVLLCILVVIILWWASTARESVEGRCECRHRAVRSDSHDHAAGVVLAVQRLPDRGAPRGRLDHAGAGRSAAGTAADRSLQRRLGSPVHVALAGQGGSDLAPPTATGDVADLASTTDDDFPQFLGPNRDARLPKSSWKPIGRVILRGCYGGSMSEPPGPRSPR
jgi:hypothetical protein